MYSLFPEADTLLNSNTSTLSNRGTWDEHCVHCFQHQSPTAEEGDEKDEGKHRSAAPWMGAQRGSEQRALLFVLT